VTARPRALFQSLALAGVRLRAPIVPSGDLD
jgi:hypothetical protein